MVQREMFDEFENLVRNLLKSQERCDNFCITSEHGRKRGFGFNESKHIHGSQKGRQHVVLTDRHQISIQQRWALATFFLVRNRNSAIAILQSQTQNRNFAIAIPQLEGSTSAIDRYSATFQRNVAWQPQHRNSAIAIFLKSATSSPQLESFTSAIFGIFLALEELDIMFSYLQVFFTNSNISAKPI